MLAKDELVMREIGGCMGSARGCIEGT